MESILMDFKKKKWIKEFDVHHLEKVETLEDFFDLIFVHQIDRHIYTEKIKETLNNSILSLAGGDDSKKLDFIYSSDYLKIFMINRDLFRLYYQQKDVVPLELSENRKVLTLGITRDTQILPNWYKNLTSFQEIPELEEVKFKYLTGRNISRLEELLEAKLKEINNLKELKGFYGDLALEVLVREARSLKATDIHIHPKPNIETRGVDLVVAYRINTELEEMSMYKFSIPKGTFIVNALVSRAGAGSNALYKLGGVTKTITDFFSDRTTNLRVRGSSAFGGTYTVARILETDNVAMKLSELGFLKEDIREIEKLCMISSGIIFIGGKVGSGKTTTTSAMIRFMDEKRKIKIVELAETVEIATPCLRIEVSGEALTLAVQGIKKEDPDIVVIPEIPTRKTADDVADLYSSNIGVIATGHFERCFSIPYRLSNLYPDDYTDRLLQFRGIVVQKMFKKLCPHCKVKKVFSDLDQDSKEYFLSLGLNKDEHYVYENKLGGCEECFNGYVKGGRIPIPEILRVSEDLRDILSKSQQIRYHASEMKKFMLEKKALGEFKARDFLLKGEISLSNVVKSELNVNICDYL